MREPIAIIGMGCRFPGGVNSPETLWELLCAERSAISEVPADRYDIQAFYDPRPATPGKVMSKWGGFLDQIDHFDPLFFGISPREAERMDPQQRLLLEVAWEAMEDAGQVPNTPRIQQTGVFVGMWLNDFESRLFRDPSQTDFYMTTGSGRYTASGRLSYVFGLQGPSITIDSACSSSLVAVHLAVQSLRSGECNLALAGGANVILQPHITIAYSQSRMMAPDGRCKFGDARADGYVRSEGAGILVLKRLSDALADRDPIYAVIRGSATNNDGRSSGYLTTPGSTGQEEMLRKAYHDAALSPTAVQYIEAHGTGTAAGDPVEIGAIGAIVAQGRRPGDFCTVGSIKTNLGHTEGAAGVAGLMKVALALKHRQIPASLNYESPNPSIPWESLPVRVQTARTDWPAEQGQGIGGVSSFGIAGTNAHVVLQEAPSFEGLDAPRQSAYIVPLSGHTPDALKENAAAFEKIGLHNDLHDLAYSASVRRSHHAYRLAVVSHSESELVEQLKAFNLDEVRTGLIVGSSGERTATRRIVFIFPGQGAQWLGMGRQLYEQEAAFREALNRCAIAISPYVDWDLLDIVLGNDNSASRFEEIDIIQPTLFAIQVALAELWRAYGVQPDAVVGHSMGEVAAAYISGILSLENAAKIICYRSQLMKRVSGKGAMAMVELPFEKARAALNGYRDKVDVAVTNSPRSCVLSGEPDTLADVVALFERQDIFCRPVNVNVAAHSPQMDPLRPELVSGLNGLQSSEAVVPVYSTVTGRLHDGSDFDAFYWGENLRQPVLFAQAVQQVLEDGYNTFIEISPHPILLPGIERGLLDYGLEDEQAAAVVTLPSTKRNEDERHVILESLGKLYAQGFDVDWNALYPHGGRSIQLPRYAWQRDRYWFETQFAYQPASLEKQHPLLGERRRSAVQSDSYSWEIRLDLEALPYLADHRVEGSIVLPAAAFAEMALAALAEISDGGELESLTIDQALVLSESRSQLIQLIIAADLLGTFAFRILSCPSGNEGEWTQHASGILRIGAPQPLQAFSLEAFQSRCQVLVEQVDYYQAMQKRGLEYGPHFQMVSQFWHDETQQEGLGLLQAGDTTQEDAYQIHPTLMDGCLQMLVALLPPGEDTYLPLSVDRVCLYSRPDFQADCWGYAVRTSAMGEIVDGDVFLVDSAGNVCLGVYGMRLERVDRLKRANHPLDQLVYQLEWQEIQLPETEQEKPSQFGSWLLLADDQEMAPGLIQQLASYGEETIVVSVGSDYSDLGLGHYVLRPDEPKDFQRLLQELDTQGRSNVRGILYLWGVGNGQPSETSAETLVLNETRDCLGVLHLIQALAQSQLKRPPRLWLVTRGAQMLEGAGDDIGQSMLWGLGAVIANEYPEFQLTRVDLDPNAPITNTQALVSELHVESGEDQIVLRNGKRYSARLIKGLSIEDDKPNSVKQWMTAAEQPFSAQVSTPGILDSIEFRAIVRSVPPAGQVEIEVYAVGLNFMNVLSALGTKPGYADGVGPLGIECAGVITAIGDGVEGFQIGDEVMAVAFDSLASHALADAHLVMHKPTHLSFVEAASIPIVFLTAYYSLFTRAQLEAGESVLIHAAAGGVGLAAVQLAQQAGAEIYATVGSAEKRSYLQSLGVQHIMDSRKLIFAQEILELTAGQGVDVVLNSLAGEAISRGLAVLRPYGRFVEIGARDIYENRQVGLMPFHKNLAYFAVDLDKMARERPATLGTIFRQLVERFNTGELTPIPTHVFPIDEAGDAFRYMAQAKHIGKIVLEQTHKPLPITFAADSHPPICADNTYLITGGLGGLGLTVAQWLVEQGARYLVLVGRRGASADAQAVIHQLEQLGVVVVVAQADVADVQAVARVLDMIEVQMPSLRGVFHAAGILDDSLLSGMTRDQMRRVLAPKVDGAWNLHSLTEGESLDFFVLFSSATALLGTPGQGNYAAGNAFLDALAHYRRARGLPALSINWGPWSDIGLAAAESIRGERLASRGLDSLSPEEGIEVLQALLMTDSGPQVAVMEFDASLWTKAYPASANTSLLAFIQQAFTPADMSTTSQQASKDFRQMLLNSEPGRPRRSLFESLLRDQIAQVLRVDAARIGLHQPLRELGIDSLLTLELRNRLEAGFKLTLSATLIFNYPTIAALTQFLANKLDLQLDKKDDEPERVEVPKTSQAVSSELDMLSHAEIEALLEDELKSIDDLLKGL